MCDRLTKTRKLPVMKMLVTLIAGLGGTLASAGFTQHAAINRESVTGIVFVMAPEHSGQFGFDFPVQPLVEQVSHNLAEWHYPVKAAISEPTSHRLQAIIGSIQKDATPVGFSFSSGNSDPRAGDFQKAQVMPVTCRLTTLKSAEPLAEYKTTASADELLPDHKKSVNAAKIVAKLTDEISTACFNLLDNLDLQTHPPLSQAQPSKPSWIPNVSIEIKNEADTQQSPTAVATKQDKAVTVEKDNPRQQIIIHNQGTPLILEFGHQRR